MRIGRHKIPQSWFVNASAGALGLFLVVFVVRDFFVKEEVPTCSDRYAHGTVFALQNRSGELISAPELQGRLAGDDLGVLENVKVVRTDQGPAPIAMQIRLAPVEPQDGASEGLRPNGVAFTWLPRRLPSAQSICLTYSFRMPEEFPMGPGGNLPGLAGGSDSAEPEQLRTGFVVRPRWSSDGRMDLRLVTEENQQPQAFGIDHNWLKIATGPWIKMEQELLLNTPGQPDGIVRIWVDGKLKLEKTGIAFRKEKDSRVQGVVVTVGYFGKAEPPRAANGHASAIEVTPFEVRWP